MTAACCSRATGSAYRGGADSPRRQLRGVEIGVYSFADTAPDPRTGVVVDPERRLRDLIEEIELADQVGLEVYGVGEHHRPDFAASAPAVVLAAAAERTVRIRLTSAVTVLSSDDPVRVFQDFATLDLLSGGRAEIMVGRGSFIESFPLFGYDLDLYDELFAEKLDLLLRLRDAERVTWTGRHRPPLDDRGVYPRPLQDPLPVWLAVGGTPNRSSGRASSAFPLALAIIGGHARAVRAAHPTSTATRRARPDTTPRSSPWASTSTSTWPTRPGARPTSSTRPTRPP